MVSNEWSLEAAVYIILWYNWPPFFSYKFLKILMVSDKTIHKTFRIHKTLQTKNKLEKFLIFTVYQKYMFILFLTY